MVCLQVPRHIDTTQRTLTGYPPPGSGKTLAYLLPMMVHIMAQEELKANEGPVGVVLCPTRELALQIDTVAKEYIGPSGLRSTCIYGGARVQEQGWALREKNDIVVATPGRFIQLLNEGWTNLNRVTYVVLDEADEMLSQGFGGQIRLILSQVRPDRQMLMFSATWPEEVQHLAAEHCTNTSANGGLGAVTVRVGGDRLAACRTIQQTVLVLGQNVDKFDKLREAIVRSRSHKQGSAQKCLIFCRTTKAIVDELVVQLEASQIEALRPFGRSRWRPAPSRFHGLHHWGRRAGSRSRPLASRIRGAEIRGGAVWLVSQGGFSHLDSRQHTGEPGCPLGKERNVRQSSV
ncbi:unnamed protein product [Prorocentrum cordatum]|uniref:Helicase ATP-binding domain-containing protein n=1 Tax=Prorocentrum cordatum TaxID=2364126 RepID=A0ABN9R6F5_9DINO|nr:unnamed protein product [Polarella glacialis]